MSRMTLEQLLKQDPLGKMWQQVNDRGAETYAIYGEEFESESLEIANAALSEALKDPEKNSIIVNHRNWAQEGVNEIAALAGANPVHLYRYLELSTLIHTAGQKAYKKTLQRSWRALLPHSNIIPLGKGEFPAAMNKPFIVFYSADWCFPCWVTKPVLARLSRFFTKVPLFYVSDDEIRKREGIQYVPYLAAYLLNGSVVTSQCGGTTEELWKTLNLLIDLGKGFEGRGELVCTETECKIVNPE